jgi:hypothetical protein
MKKLIVSTLMGLMLLIGFLTPVTVFAVDVFEEPCRQNPDASACLDDQTQTQSSNEIFGPDGVLTKAAELVAVIVGVASVIMIIVGGFKYVTSSGDPNNVKSAKDTILFAIVGMLVAISTQAIVLFVLERL